MQDVLADAELSAGEHKLLKCMRKRRVAGPGQDFGACTPEKLKI